MSKEVALLPSAETALQVFTEPGGLDPYLQAIHAEVEGFVPDLSTKKGRDAIASLAHKVAKSRVALDNVGKELTAKYKEIPKQIDAARKSMRENLEELQDKIRAPLTEWENNEKARVDGIKARIAEIDGMADCRGAASLEIADRLRHLDTINHEDGFDEFAGDAAAALVKARKVLADELEVARTREAEQAELERLRKEAAEREQAEREHRIAVEAAAKAVREAEAKAQREREQAEAAAKAEKAAAERRELELKLQKEHAEREAQAAIARAEQAKREAEAQAQAALEAERKRIRDEADREAAEKAKREADRNHKAAVMRAAKEAFMAAGLTEDQAKVAVTAIKDGRIPAVRIEF